MQEKLLLRFASSARSGPSGELYFPREVAHAIVAACVDEKMIILGWEAFSQRGGAIHPSLDLIADFSTLFADPAPWDERVERSASESKRFLHAVAESAEDLVVTVVISEAEPR